MKAYCDRNIDRWLEEEARKKPTVERMYTLPDLCPHGICYYFELLMTSSRDAREP